MGLLTRQPVQSKSWRPQTRSRITTAGLQLTSPQLRALLTKVDALIDTLEAVRPRNAMIDSLLAQLEELHNYLTTELDASQEPPES